MKKSFALLFAIIFIVVLGLLGTFMMVFSTLNVKQTEENYLNVQSELYARSATEAAIQALEARDFATDGCINRMNINTSLYEINMTFHYFLMSCPTDCNCTSITTQDSNGTVMINTYVKNKETNMTFFRQTLQKP